MSEREREREIDVRGKCGLVASHTCFTQGSNLQPRYEPLQGTEYPSLSVLEATAEPHWPGLLTIFKWKIDIRL